MPPDPVAEQPCTSPSQHDDPVADTVETEVPLCHQTDETSQPHKAEDEQGEEEEEERMNVGDYDSNMPEEDDEEIIHADEERAEGNSDGEDNVDCESSDDYDDNLAELLNPGNMKRLEDEV